MAAFKYQIFITEERSEIESRLQPKLYIKLFQIDEYVEPPNQQNDAAESGPHSGLNRKALPKKIDSVIAPPPPARRGSIMPLTFNELKDQLANLENTILLPEDDPVLRKFTALPAVITAESSSPTNPLNLPELVSIDKRRSEALSDKKRVESIRVASQKTLRLGGDLFAFIFFTFLTNKNR